MKRYLLFCQLALLCSSVVRAQFVTGPEGFFITADTEVAIDGLTMRPGTDFVIADRSLTRSSTPVPGNPTGIARVYNFNQPIDFVGTIGFFYQTAELNGNPESSLQLAHGNVAFVTVPGSTVDEGVHYISNDLTSATNFTSVTAAQEGALPVRLVDFYVRRVESRTMLYWQTSSEKNSYLFEVQQSTDARNWTAIGSVRAAEESHVLKSYSFADNLLRSGRQYYRLKMLDVDESYTYSPIRSIALGQIELVSAYPNPVTDKLIIGKTEGVASIGLADQSGKSLVRVSKPAAGQQIDMSGYPSGVYLLQFKMADGEKQVTKIVKH